MDTLIDDETTRRWRQYWGSRQRTFTRAGLRFEVSDTGARVYDGDKLVRTFRLTDTPQAIDEALCGK